MEIETSRFRLRELSEADVTERYLQWLRDPDVRQHIASSSLTRDLDDLRAYVRARAGRGDVLFLGIFDRERGTHVGNIKYEPLDSDAGFAVMGILIGDPAYRGSGAAAEVLDASTAWLKAHRGIHEVVLTVDGGHARAIRAYEAAGFRPGESPHYPPLPGLVSMVRRL
jgi:RimJ/RimL family protein N-acetyltransferase